jgi:CRP/FNR family cyclic AMP-dependent transcriptional regulator
LTRSLAESNTRALAELRARGVAQHYPPGARLFIAGAPARAVYLIEEGVAKLIGEGGANKEFITCFRSTGAIVGSAPAIATRAYTVSAVAVYRLDVHQIAAVDFVRLTQTSLDVSGYVNRLQSNYICDHLHTLCVLALLPARARLIDFLGRVIGHLPDTSTKMVAIPPLMNRDIAAAIAVTPTHLSRLLRELEADGVVQRKGSRILVPRSLTTDVTYKR